MGTQYFLIRRDSQTLYELGKVREWRTLFDDGLATIEALMGVRRPASELDEPYFERLLASITAWLAGHPVEFIDEFVLEDLPYRCRTTGTRFCSEVYGE